MICENFFFAYYTRFLNYKHLLLVCEAVISFLY